MPLRELNQAERLLLDFLLAKPFSGRDALSRQAETVQTGGSSCTCGCPSFSLVPDKSLPPTEISGRAMVSDADGLDPGGTEVGVLLFIDEGYLFDVEVFNYGDAFGGLPHPSALKIRERSAPDSDGHRRLLNP